MAEKFIAGDVDTAEQFNPGCRWHRWKTFIHDGRWIFEKSRNDPTGLLKGPGGHWFMKKKTEIENLVSDSL